MTGRKDSQADMLEEIDQDKYLVLANTSGAMNAEEAVRLARLAVAAGLPKWIKLEIHPDPRYLLPDPIETLKATEILVKEGFTILPYIQADPVLAKRLEEVGAATVMPLGISVIRPEEVCILVTNSFIAPSCSGVALITRSIPSPIRLRSESVTRTAISTKTSESRESPVISQSIQIKWGSSAAISRSLGGEALAV